MFLVPSLNPIRLRGVACEVDVEDVRPKPSCDQRITAVPRARRAKLRITWNATCGSFAQACTHRSPPLCPASKASPGNGGNSANAAGRRAASPNRSSKSAGPNPTVIVNCDGGRPSASPVSIGGASGALSTGPIGSPLPIWAPADAHVARTFCRSERSLLVTSKAAKANRSCAGVAIPAWCGP